MSTRVPKMVFLKENSYKQEELLQPLVLGLFTSLIGLFITKKSPSFTSCQKTKVGTT